MKKLIVLPVVFALALGLVIGCGDKKPTDSGDIEETPSTVENSISKQNKLQE